MDHAGIARALKERGAALGLSAVGIAAVEPTERAGFLERWLRAGYAGAMTWMERTAPVRADLRRRFAWARSAVVGAVSYLPYGGDRRAQEGLAARVARYALGRDYHHVLTERLEVLAAFLAAEAPGARARVCVDTGPILEREVAARAGLGWFGKSTNLIRPRGDSWILLGEILTDLDLPPDEPVADRCGSCTACLDACPTGAILEPYVLDSNRCISYLTIELRGAIPEARRAALGDWVFGCDVCQEVCPWNRKVEATRDAAFAPGAHLRGRTLADLVGLDDATFRAGFRDTPLGRPRRQGLVRNALIVAANTGDDRALEAARGLREDPDPVIRETARWALGKGGYADQARPSRARSSSAPAGPRLPAR